MLIVNWIIPILWLAFIIYWFVSALRSKRSIRSGLSWRSAGIRVVLLILVILAFHFPLFSSSVRSSTFYFSGQGIFGSSIWLRIIGLIVCAAGLAFAVWARIYLGRNWGMPMTLQEGHELVTGGPYAFVRHPIYTGFLLAIAGSALAEGLIWLAVLIVSGTYFIYSAYTEEKIMLEQFPNEYPAYMKRTKRLIPFVW